MPYTDYRTISVPNDYEIEMLIKRANYYNNISSSDGRYVALAYFYTRTMLKYMARLIFSIGWSKIKSDAIPDATKNVYAKLFKDPTIKRGTDSIEPGTFANALRECANLSGVYPKVRSEIGLLYKIGNVRNYNAHVTERISFTSFFSDADAAVEEFITMFSGKSCYYVVFRERNGGMVKCSKLTAGCEFPEDIFLSANIINGSANGNRVFYAVSDNASGNTIYYNLSPFIEAPKFIDTATPHFRVYEHVDNNGYGNECLSLRYHTLVPENLREEMGESGRELEADFPSTQEDYRISDLFEINMLKTGTSLWYQSAIKSVFINISSYPGFEEVRKNTYKYCGAVCPVRNQVLAFCKDTNKQVALVTGNGGVGKTALMLSIISELYNAATTDYTNIIFLSAKKKIYSNTSTGRQLLDYEKEADIHGYGELVAKLADLLDVSADPANAEITASRLTSEINNLQGKGKKFLLIIDDLDSMSSEDQMQTSKLIYEFNSKVFKSIITTRNIAENSPVCFQIRELNEQQSLKFAAWHTEANLGISPWSSWTRRSCAEEWIKNNGEGNPLIIQMIIELVLAGLEDNFSAPATQRERNAYFYNTVQNLLSDREQTVFEIARQINTALHENIKSNEILLALPQYLSLGCDIDREEFDIDMYKLAQLKLVHVDRNQETYSIYSPFLFNDDIIELTACYVPPIFDLFWNNMRNNPEKWLNPRGVENSIVELIVSSEHADGFNIVTARKIMEGIYSSPYTYEKLKEKVKEWLTGHTISHRDKDSGEISSRIIQSTIDEIEVLWDSIKKVLDADGIVEDDELSSFTDKMRQLRLALKENPNRLIEDRFTKIRNELRCYDL